jgi:hypothetical protein
MKRTLPIASQPAALASTFPPTSDNVMAIPSDINSFRTFLVFAGTVRESTLYSRKNTRWGPSGKNRGAFPNSRIFSGRL